MVLFCWQFHQILQNSWFNYTAEFNGCQFRIVKKKSFWISYYAFPFVKHLLSLHFGWKISQRFFCSQNVDYVCTWEMYLNSMNLVEMMCTYLVLCPLDLPVSSYAQIAEVLVLRPLRVASLAALMTFANSIPKQFGNRTFG